MNLQERIKAILKDVPDFPKPGIVFKDITPLFLNPGLSGEVADEMAKWAVRLKPDVIAGIESRGFMLGFTLAQKLGIPFIPLRKPGKLPREVFSADYSLEYGNASLQLHKEDLVEGQRVIIHDDLLATGGTAMAAVELCRMAGAEVAGLNFIIELAFLHGRKTFGPFPVQSLVTYP